MIQAVGRQGSKELKDMFFVDGLVTRPVLALHNLRTAVPARNQVTADVGEAFDDSLVMNLEPPTLVFVPYEALIVASYFPLGL